MALSPRVKFALAVGGGAAVAGAGVWVWTALTKDKPKGPRRDPILCPAAVGRDAAPTASVKRGDFVVIQLQSPDGSYHESTWATVIGKTAEELAVVITGEQLPEGVRPLATDKHGIRLGHRMLLKRDCVWEVFRPVKVGGQILCGPQVAELAKFLEDEDLGVVAGGLIIEQGDRARIIVGSKESFGNAWNEELWTRVVTISPTGQVITARVDDDPELTKRHGLTRGSIVRYNRDCVIGV